MINNAAYPESIKLYNIVLEEVRRQADISKVSKKRKLFENMTINHDLQNDLSYESDEEPMNNNSTTHTLI